ncbi:MAG: M81 family metallopeptidase [Pseudomonadales bacterium]
MRIALAGISHETNTYCAQQTPAAEFYQLRGPRMLQAAGQETDLGGAVDACASLQVEAVPILYAIAQPSGLIARAAYEQFRDEIVDGLLAQEPLDGVVLLLHGAGVVDGIHDLEGDLVTAVRGAMGEALPIAASFDLHGNVTQAMVSRLNGVFACHQYPHIDMHAQAAAAVRLVAQMQAEDFRAQCAMRNLPMLLPTTTTFEGIGQQMLEAVLAAEAQGEGVIDLSWFHGFPYTDVPHVGSALVATMHPGVDPAPLLDRVSALLWSAREQFGVISLSAEEAVAAAGAAAKNATYALPVVIHETSDNCGAGTPGDGTHLLRAMLEAQLGSEACFGFIVDAAVAAQAHAAGVGQRIQIILGGKTDDLHGEPIVADAYVKALHDGRLIMQHMNKGARLNIGPTARLSIEDLDVVVASRRSQTFDREPFLAVGISVERYRYIALKSSNHFRAGFADIAGTIVTADPPGLSTHRIDTFPRQTTARRFWPIHPDAVYPEASD